MQQNAVCLFLTPVSPKYILNMRVLYIKEKKITTPLRFKFAYRSRPDHAGMASLLLCSYSSLGLVPLAFMMRI